MEHGVVVGTGRRAFLLALAGGALGGGGLLAGCGPSGSSAAGSPSSSAPAPVPVQVQVAVDGVSAGQVASRRPVVRASVTGGSLASVVVTGADGAAVEGSLGSDGTWSPTAPLALGAAYTATATAAPAGAAASSSPSGSGSASPSATGAAAAPGAASAQVAFTVAGADQVAGVKMMPLDGEVVGVGMPVALIFAVPVPVADRAGVTG
ncbi:Ig-like domain-containing protein, partial [Quadrisphaera oryzae]